LSARVGEAGCPAFGAFPGRIGSILIGVPFAVSHTLALPEGSLETLLTLPEQGTELLGVSCRAFHKLPRYIKPFLCLFGRPRSVWSSIPPFSKALQQPLPLSIELLYPEELRNGEFIGSESCLEGIGQLYTAVEQVPTILIMREHQ
jgi:hypothetical protein